MRASPSHKLYMGESSKNETCAQAEWRALVSIGNGYARVAHLTAGELSYFILHVV